MKKKLFVILLTGLLVFSSAVGCGKEKKEEKPELNIVFYTGERVENGKKVYDFYRDNFTQNNIGGPFTFAYDGEPHTPLVRIEEVGKPGVEVIPLDAKTEKGYPVVSISYYNINDLTTPSGVPVKVGEYDMQVTVQPFRQYKPIGRPLRITIT